MSSECPCSLNEGGRLVQGLAEGPRLPGGSDVQESGTRLSCMVRNFPEYCHSLPFGYCPFIEHLLCAGCYAASALGELTVFWGRNRHLFF